MNAIQLLKQKLTELDSLCGHQANHPGEISSSELNFKIGEVNALLELLECPESGRGVYNFLHYYAENYHLDEFTRSPHQEALKAAFDEWLAKVEA